MNKSQAEAYETMIWGDSIIDVERKIESLTNSIAQITVTNNDLREDPRKALREMREKQLRGALEAYGKVDLSQLDIERIPMVFARLQAAEAQIRNDIANMDQLANGEKDFKKQLEIAKVILAEKIQPGGRA